MFISLSQGVSIRLLEGYFLYNRNTDELYEINQEAFEFLKKLDGTFPSHNFPDKGFLGFLLKEKLVELSRVPKKKRVVIREGPKPSLRYLELQITERCNLSCRHCYQKKKSAKDMPLELISKILGEFEDMGGLRVMVSGGEPLLHKEIQRVLDILSSNSYTFRRVLLTNGTIFIEGVGKAFDEVQISIDGLEEGHDYIRGRGSFKKAIENLKKYLSLGLDVSVATMIHGKNLEELDDLQRLLKDLGVKEWGLDVPCDYQDVPDPITAAKYLSYSFGGGYHGGSQGMGCGFHLLTVLPGGEAVRCGFYSDVLGDLKKEPLKDVWSRKRPFNLSETECKDCLYIEECGGGCRYRAGEKGKDPYMCALFGIYVQKGSSSR